MVPAVGTEGVSLARGTFLGVRADVVTAIATIAVSIVVSRALGPENRGIFFLAFTAATLISIVGNFGMNTAAIVYAANKELPLREIHGVALAFSAVLGMITAGLLLPFEEFWTSTVLKGLDTTMLVLLAAGVPALLYAQVGVAALAGLGRIPAVSWIRIGVQVGTMALVIPVAIVTEDPRWTLGAWLVIAVGFALAIGSYMTLRAAPPSLPSAATVRELLSFAGRGYVGSIAYQGFLRIDLFFIGARSGPAQVGVYSLSTVMAERISMVGQALYAASAAQIGSSEREQAARLTAQLVRILLLALIPTAVVLGLLSIPGIPLVFGDDFSSAVVPFVLLLPGTVSLTLWAPVSLLIISNLRRPGTTAIIMGSALLASLPLYYWMILWLDMSGAAIASSIVYMSVLAGGVAVMTRATSVDLADLAPRRADVGQVVAIGRSALRSLRRAG